MSATFLFDDADGQSVFIPAKSFDHAEQLAEEKGLTLVGRFLHFVDEETGEIEYLQ